jgi:hypothetical protein
LRDQVAGFRQGAGRRLHFLDNLLAGLERTGDLAHLGDEALHRIAGQPGLLGEGLLEELEKSRRAARLQDVVMREAEALLKLVE